jgi:hypothetical protein
MSKPKNLGMPKVYWEIEVKDKNGKLIEHKRFKSHSWLKQWIQILKGEFATRHAYTVGSGNVNINDEGGSSRAYPPHTTGTQAMNTMNLSTLGDAGDVTQGIIVGSSDTSNSLATYSLASKIGHGSGSGQLIYGAETVEDVSNPSGMNLQFRVIRAFTNNSGASVTAKEIGILVKKVDTSFNARSFLIVRDVLSSPSSVPDGATMTVRYIIKITVS